MYQWFMKNYAVPLNQRAHNACVVMEALGYRFCVDFGYQNAEEMIEQKGLREEITNV